MGTESQFGKMGSCGDGGGTAAQQCECAWSDGSWYLGTLCHSPVSLQCCRVVLPAGWGTSRRVLSGQGLGLLWGESSSLGVRIPKELMSRQERQLACRWCSGPLRPLHIPKGQGALVSPSFLQGMSRNGLSAVTEQGEEGQVDSEGPVSPRRLNPLPAGPTRPCLQQGWLGSLLGRPQVGQGQEPDRPRSAPRDTPPPTPARPFLL